MILIRKCVTFSDVTPMLHVTPANLAKINKILTLYDMGYKNGWAILAPPWKIRKVTFDITI
ncbi:hypothetical protein [Pseudoalteromonas phage PHS21]|nr:hypothetical protein [Pseudoalteromonas phage PHS21]